MPANGSSQKIPQERSSGLEEQMHYLHEIEQELKRKAKKTFKEELVFILTHRISLSFFFSSVILLYLAVKIDYGELSGDLERIRLLPLFFAVMAMVGVIHLRALRWYLLLRMKCPELEFRDFIFPFYLGDALSVFIPMKLGEALAMGIPPKYLKVPLSVSLSTTWFYRLFDMSLVTLTVIILFPILFRGTTGFELVITATILVLLFFLYGLFNQDFGFKVARTLKLKFLEDNLEQIYTDLGQMRSSAMMGTFFLSFLVWLLFSLMIVFVMAGFGADTGILVMVAAVGIYVAVGVPLSSAGIGAGTLGSVYVLRHAGDLPESQALAVMLVYGFIIAVVQGAFGLLGNIMTHSVVEKRFRE